jgi:hypothetical protein
MKLFELIDISDKDEDSRQVCYILEFFQFLIHEGEDGKCLFQLVYEYDPYGWTNPLFASGFSILEYASLFYMYFKFGWSVINFSIFADSKFRHNL